jgi:hypothetical protein
MSDPTLDPFAFQDALRDTPSEEIVSPYQRLYGLRENPFPVMAMFTPTADDPRVNGSIYDRSFRLVEECRFFELFVRTATGDLPQQIGFIRLDPFAGGRGNGKSSFLNRLMERINGRDWAGCTAQLSGPDLFALAVHVLPEPRRQKRFWQFVQLIFKTLDERGLYRRIDENLRAALIFRLLTREQIDNLRHLPADERARLFQSREAFDALLGQYDLTRQAYADELERQLRDIAPGGMTSLFNQAFFSTGADLTTFWETWKQQGVTENVYRWRGDGVGWLLNSLIPILIVAGYRRFYLLLDEFEKIYTEQTARERTEFLDSFRQYFYERDSAAVQRRYITTILTVHPSIDRVLADVWQRVGLNGLAPLDPQQMTHQSVNLGASTIDKLTHLLITYLDYFRMGEEERASLYPFANDALLPAIEAARNYPRGTLWYAYNILQRAAAEGREPPITREYVQDFVQSNATPPIDDYDAIFRLPDSDSASATPA